MEVHRCRFVEHFPSGVSHMALNKDSSLLAVARSNASIEIWNIQKDWIIEKIIPGGENLSVECLVWTKDDRLFSAGHHAQITQWDLVNLKAQNSSDSFGGAVWSLALNDACTTLAAACEDGCVRLFDISEGSLVYKKSLVGDKARILSVFWQPKSNFIVTGSSEGVIRRWNTVTARPTHRMTVDTVKGVKALVWSVVALEDGTIVSGDSLGHVQFWDGEMGTLLETFSSHSADILSVVAHFRGDSVYAAGVDNQIVQFRLLKEKGKWFLSEKNRAHTHDVKALAISSTSNLLISGGVDTNLISYTADKFPKILKEINSYPQKPLISLSQGSKILCCQFPQKIELWALGATYAHDSTTDMVNGTNLALSKREEKLVELTSKNGGNIVCSAVSNDGKWLVFSNSREVKLFRLKMEKGKMVVSKVSQDVKLGPGQGVAFTQDSAHLLIAGQDRTLKKMDLTSSPTLVASHTWSSSDETFRTLAVSPDGNFAAIGDTYNRIHVFSLSPLERHSSLPIFHTPHTALAFHPSLPLLLVAYSSFEYNVFDLTTKTLSKEFPAQKIPYPTPKDKKNKVIGITFHPQKPLTTLFYGLTYISPVVLNEAPTSVASRPAFHKQKKVKTGDQKKKGKDVETKEDPEVDDDQPVVSTDMDVDEQKGASTSASENSSGSQIVTRYSPMLYFEALDENSFIVVERPWLSIIQKFPAPLYRPRYGT